MSERLDILKTYKLFINGQHPRSESGRALPIVGRDGRVMGHSCLASRKDLRDAVVAARGGLGKWKSATPYLRGQILYRAAEMLQARGEEFVKLLGEGPEGSREQGIEPGREVALAVDRLVAFAGWCDKFAQVLGGANPVSGPYWNITVPEPAGVIGIVAPKTPALLGLVSLMAPVLCAGNTCVIVSEGFVPVVSTLGEVLATSDLPAGVVNLLTGTNAELVGVLSQHRDVDGVLASGVSDEHRAELRAGSADNLKRVTVLGETDWSDSVECESPWRIEPLVEFKSVWHPVGA